MASELYVLHAVAPLHLGSGRGEGLIDLPIARDGVTGHPLVPGSSVKGVLRDATPVDHRTTVFGPETANASDHAGALRVTDARLLLMPVSSDLGTFAWVTCPWLLALLVRDGAKVPDKVPRVEVGKALVCDKSMLMDTKQQAWLGGEPFGMAGLVDKAWAEALGLLTFGDEAWWREALKGRLAIVSDDAFTAFARSGTDVRAHIRIDDESGTVAKGGLWYEESLPTEAVLTGVIQAVPAPKQRITAAQVLDLVRDQHGKTLQFGGNATTGMGRCRFRLMGAR